MYGRPFLERMIRQRHALGSHLTYRPLGTKGRADGVATYIYSRYPTHAGCLVLVFFPFSLSPDRVVSGTYEYAVVRAVGCNAWGADGVLGLRNQQDYSKLARISRLVNPR